MTKIIVLSATELEDIIQHSVRTVLSEFLKYDKHTIEFLSVEETAKFLNLSVTTIYGLTSKNQIPFIKKSKRLYFKKSELEDWLVKGRRKTMDEINQEVKNHIKKRFI